MIVSVASGKGGTGKTTVTASLATVWNTPLIVADYDVEEPNLHLFLHPTPHAEQTVYMEVPVVDMGKCTLCKKCSELCQFKAISAIGKKLLVFSEMCHGCGGCMAICPEGAISCGTRELGVIMQGTLPNALFVQGQLRIGEAMTPPLLRAEKKHIHTMLQQFNQDVLIDAPPGVSCPAVNAVAGSDVIVLVTEPTPFGLHDLTLAVETTRALGKKFGVVINRYGMGDDAVEAYCQSENIAILAKIPHLLEIAQCYSAGKLIYPEVDSFKQALEEIAIFIKTLSQEEVVQ